MKKINLNDVPEEVYRSEKGKFHVGYRDVSLALGSDPKSTDRTKRHPFELELCRIPAGAANYPFHSHSAQWELYVVVFGRGLVRDDAGTTEVVAGDSFMFGPGEAHQISNPGPEDLLYHVIADNPVGESCHYPDSGKWSVMAGSQRVIAKGSATSYLDGEE